MRSENSDLSIIVSSPESSARGVKAKDAIFNNYFTFYLASYTNILILPCKTISLNNSKWYQHHKAVI